MSQEDEEKHRLKEQQAEALRELQTLYTVRMHKITNPWEEIYKVRAENAALRVIAEMFKFYIDNRPGTILVSDGGISRDIADWLEEWMEKADITEAEL